jgi:hypothetical protein
MTSAILNDYVDSWTAQIKSGAFFFRKKRIDSDSDSNENSGETKLARVLNTLDLTALGIINIFTIFIKYLLIEYFKIKKILLLMI